MGYLDQLDAETDRDLMIHTIKTGIDYLAKQRLDAHQVGEVAQIADRAVAIRDSYQLRSVYDEASRPAGKGW